MTDRKVALNSSIADSTQEFSPDKIDESLYTRLVDLNRDHHRRMYADSQSMSETTSIIIDNKDSASRTSITNAMIGCSLKFGINIGGNLIELGAGREGRDKSTLVAKFNADYTGIEVVPEIAASSGVFCCSIETMPKEWTGKFKWVYSRHVMEHVIDVDIALSKIESVMAEDGIVGAVTPHYFPDPEIAHVTQLRLDQWMAAYRRHKLIPVYAVTAHFNCEEAHLVLVKKSYLESKLSSVVHGSLMYNEIKMLLA